MDLRKGEITIGELLNDVKSKGVFQRRFPMVVGRPMAPAAYTITLNQLTAVAGTFLPKAMVTETVRELERL